jgi:hypothetical protein
VYVVVAVREKGSYRLRELDGTVMQRDVAGNRVKRFYVRDDDWLIDEDETDEELIEDDQLQEGSTVVGLPVM